MSTARALGGSAFSEAVVRGRHATQSARHSLKRLIDEAPGPQTSALLIAKTALAISDIEAALNELDEIGRKAKNKIDK